MKFKVDLNINIYLKQEPEYVSNVTLSAEKDKKY